MLMLPARESILTVLKMTAEDMLHNRENQYCLQGI